MNFVLPAKPGRKPRADSVRNRERVLAAAKTLFAAGGPEGSLEAVARLAGVGVGKVLAHVQTAGLGPSERRRVGPAGGGGHCGGLPVPA